VILQISPSVQKPQSGLELQGFSLICTTGRAALGTPAADARAVLEFWRHLRQQFSAEADPSAPARAIEAAAGRGRALVGLAAQRAQRGVQGGF